MAKTLKGNIKRFEGEKISYINPVNGITYKNATIVHIVPAGRKLPKKYINKVGHYTPYTPAKRPYPSVVVKLEDGRICYPRISLNDLF